MTRETVRCWARQVVGMEVAEADLDALLSIVTMVLGETALVGAFNRARGGAVGEPILRFGLEEWR